MNANKQNSFEQTHYNLFLKHICFQVNEDMEEEEDGENLEEFSLAVVDVQTDAQSQASTAFLDTQVIMI